MRTLLIRSSATLLDRHACVGSPRSLLPVLRSALLREGHVDGVATLTLRCAQADPGLLPEIGGLAGEVSARQHDVQVVHALDLIAGAAALSVRRQTGVPVVVRAQLAGLTVPREQRGLWAAVLRAADCVVVPTPDDGRAARAVGAEAGRIHLCPDAALVAAAECAATPAHSGQVDAGAMARPYVLGLSGAPLDPRVRAELVEALCRDRALYIVLAGPSEKDVDQRRALVELAARRGAGNRLRLLGQVSRQRMIGLVDGARAVVATRCDPTSALAALTAMHRSRAVVGVHSAGADDVLVDGVTGRLVEVGRRDSLAGALCDIAADPFRQVAWGVAGLDRVTSRFSREGVLRSVVTAYDRVA